MQSKTLDHDHALYLMLVAIAMVLNLLNGGMTVLHETSSWSHKVASITMFGPTIGYAFIAAAMMMVPLVYALAHASQSRRAFKWGVAGSGLGSVVSVGLAFISQKMEIGWFTFYYLASGAFCLIVAGALGTVLNTNLARLRNPSLTTTTTNRS